MNLNEFSEKVMKGMDIALKKMIEEKKKNDQYVIFSENGKIIRIKARDLK